MLFYQTLLIVKFVCILLREKFGETRTPLMMRLKTMFLMVGIILTETAVGQNSLEVSSISGFKVFSQGKYSLSGMSYGGELAYNLSQQGRNDQWISRLNISDISIVAGIHNMQSVQISDSLASKGFLRNVFTASGRLTHKLFQKDRLSFSLIAGVGLAYSTSSYFKDNNPIVGSLINFTPQAGLKVKVELTPSFVLGSALNIFHYSNAGLRVPNSGVNSFQASLGLAYKLPVLVEESPAESRDTVLHFFEVGFNTGRRGAWKSRAGNWKSGLSLHYNYSLNPVISLRVGSDAVYYHTTFDGTNERYQYLATSLDPWRVGVTAGTEVALGKLAVGFDLGYYLKYKSFHPVNTYWTAGFKYYLTDVFGLQTKAYFHQAQADFIGFGIVLRRKV
jgi:hypothetical protein